LKLSIHGGRVSLVARDVPVRQILAEWARIGQTRIVNAEKLAGPPVTLDLTDVPESAALRTLLRSAAGYMVGMRPANTAGASLFDRILIMPTSSPPTAVAAPPVRQAPAPLPVLEQPVAEEEDTDDADASELNPGMPGQPTPLNPGDMPPGMVPPTPGGNVTPGAYPGPMVPETGAGVHGPQALPRPGFLPTPQTPLQPGQPGAQPQQPVPGQPPPSPTPLTPNTKPPGEPHP
jgi:hypothetical protein